MPRLTRQLISVAITAMLAAIAVYGSYLPMRKFHLFRQATQSLATIHTPTEFAALLSAPLDAPSPIGQQELVRATAQIVSILIQAERTPPPATVKFVNFVNHYFLPIFQRGKGIGFAQTVDVVGMVQVMAYVKTKDPIYLTAAENLFSRELEVSPKRAQFLYGLLEAYQLAKDTAKVKAVADTILAQWPDDQRARAALAEYLAEP